MTVPRIEVGRQVLCDYCNADYTDRTETGGLLWQSKAACPECTPSLLRDAILYGEQRFIRARCPEGMEFRAWVLALRDGHNYIEIYTGADADRALRRTVRA